MKFKVGDKVRIIKDVLNKGQYYIGEEGIVKKVEKDGVNQISYIVDVDDNFLWFAEEELELIKNNKTILTVQANNILVNITHSFMTSFDAHISLKVSGAKINHIIHKIIENITEINIALAESIEAWRKSFSQTLRATSAVAAIDNHIAKA